MAHQELLIGKRGFVLEMKHPPQEGFTILLTTGKRHRLFEYYAAGWLKEIVEFAGHVRERHMSEGQFLFRFVFKKKADKAGNWPWLEIKEDPEMKDFLYVYRQMMREFQGAVDAEGILDEQGSHLYVEQIHLSLGRMRRGV